MKAIIYTKYGPPDVLKVTELEKPEANDDEVLIKVKAAEATKSDCEIRSFRFSVKWFWLPLRIVFGVLKPRRQILGGYFSGEIVSLGKGVSDFSVGDEVYGASQIRMGAYGQYVSLPTSYTIVPKPKNMSYAQAAAVPLGGLNALHFMQRANIQPGDKILIIGAGGSIGAHGVQIAKAFGGQVTGVDSGIKEDFIRSLGADEFIDYTQRHFASDGKTYDVVFDMVPSSSYRACMSILNSKGRYLCGNPRFSIMLRSIITTRFSDKTATFAFAGETKEELRTLTSMIEDEKIQSIVDRTFSMDEAAEAHKLVETEKRIGAAVIVMD